MLLIVIVLSYSYVYGNHNITVKWFISAWIIYLAYNLFKYNQEFDKQKEKVVDIDSDFNDIKRILMITEPLKWLEYNPFLINLIQSIHIVVKYDVEILREVILDLNEFLKTYYLAIVDDKPLLYKNIHDNQIVIQKLEDNHEAIIDNMKNLVYILKINQYKDILHIPEKIQILDEYMVEKITLLARKLKIKHTSLRSL